MTSSAKHGRMDALTSTACQQITSTVTSHKLGDTDQPRWRKKLNFVNCKQQCDSVKLDHLKTHRPLSHTSLEKNKKKTKTNPL